MSTPQRVGDILAALPDTWRERAAMFERHGAVESARTLVAVADELEAATRALDDRRLTLAEASREGGYSVRQLARMIEDGRLQNHGRPHRPLLRLADVPRKPGHLPPREPVPHIGIAPGQIARSVVASLNQERAR